MPKNLKTGQQQNKKTKKEFVVAINAHRVPGYAFTVDEMPGKAFVGTSLKDAERAMRSEAARVFGNDYENINILLDKETIDLL